jgi:hypothetical protein
VPRAALRFWNTCCCCCACLTAASTPHAHGEPWHTHSVYDVNTFLRCTFVFYVWCGWEVCWGRDSAVSPLRKRGRTCSCFLLQHVFHFLVQTTTATTTASLPLLPRVCVVCIQAALWDNSPSVASQFGDSSSGRFVLDKATSTIVKVQINA